MTETDLSIERMIEHRRQLIALVEAYRYDAAYRYLGHGQWAFGFSGLAVGGVVMALRNGVAAGTLADWLRVEPYTVPGVNEFYVAAGGTDSPE
jgi:hypothetical protein